jgi:outer membrane protein OmpA-like peptidoglycan-associated protein
MMKKSILTTLVSLLILSVVAQTNVKRGDRLLKSFRFKDATEAYKAVVKKAPNDVDARQRLARSYVLAEDHVNAEATYADLLKLPNVPAVNHLYYGQELRANGKYKEADDQFNLYAAGAPSDVRGKELSNGLNKVLDLAQDKKVYAITNLPINSSASDMGPAFYKEGITYSANKGLDASVVRFDNWTGRKFYDIYVVNGDQNGNLYDAKLLKGKQPNRRFHEGPVTFANGGKEMYFTRSNYVKCKVGKSKDKIVKLKIFYASFDSTKNKWSNITPLPFNSNEYSVGHPSLSKDGKRLYFVSDMPGGYGETDVYVSYKDGATWGPPINLGKNVNTPGRELFPFIAEDGTLYYSSDTKTGLGGLDVYSANYANAEWSNVQNLGAPINTNADDFGYIIDGKNENGYFASNRTGGQGDDDIYKFKKTGITLCGTVVDARTKDVLPGSEVKLYEGDKVIGTKNAGAKGEFCFNVLPGKSYKVNATKAEYEPNGVSLTTRKENTIVQIPLSKTGGIDLAVCVTEKGKGTAEGAIVILTNKATGEKKSCVVTADCKCTFDLQPESDYEVCASKESANANGDYDKPCKQITTKGKVAPASLQENLELTYLEEGMVIKLENIYYDLDKANIRPDAEVELGKLLSLMNKFPIMEIELSSHTDCRATIKYNDQLSARRAQACVNWLISKGISGTRMIAAGYGERKLTNDCACEGSVKSNCTDAQHQANRRTEFKILKLK